MDEVAVTNGVRAAFLRAGEAAASALAEPDIAERWDERSALAGWTIGGLAGHLARGVTTVVRYLEAPAPDPDSESVDVASYVLGLVPTLDLDDPLHAAIRARGDEEAAVGSAALAATTADAVTSLGDRLANESSERLVTVAGGLILLLDDYLTTRVLELVVHIDDLAVSVGRERHPDDEALQIALAAAVDVAAARHGPLALLRFLTRAERVVDPPTAY